MRRKGRQEMTFREKMIKLCIPKGRLFTGDLLAYWCNKFHNKCSSKTCKLGEKKEGLVGQKRYDAKGGTL